MQCADVFLLRIYSNNSNKSSELSTYFQGSADCRGRKETHKKQMAAVPPIGLSNSFFFFSSKRRKGVGTGSLKKEKAETKGQHKKDEMEGPRRVRSLFFFFF